jgi:Concanavalin A-like lectin/glucanases superfamily
MPVYYAETILNDSPTSYWRCNDTTTTLADQLGLNPGSVQGTSYALGQPGGITGDPTSRSIHLPTTAYLYIADAPSLDIFTAACTIEMIIKPDSLPASGGTLWAKMLNSTAYAKPIQAITYTNGRVATDWGDGNGSNGAYPTSVALIAGAWAHLVATFWFVSTNMYASLYVNGVLLGTTGPWSSHPPSEGNYPLYFGRCPGGTPYAQPGYFSEIATYAYALTLPQILTHYGAFQGSQAAIPALSALAGQQATVNQPSSGLYTVIADDASRTLELTSSSPVQIIVPADF